jgi:glycosyltransferase involved in cell wall biosynthesis
MIKRERYKIAYVSSVDPSDATQSSGVYFFQKKSMQEYIGDIETLGPIHTSSIELLRKFLKKLFKNSPKKYDLSHSVLISKIYGCIFSRKIKNDKYDLIFGDRASTEMAYIKTHTPIIYSTDATFNAIHDYYAVFSNLARVSIFEGNKIEQTILKRASAIICASKWASDSVIQKYKINPQKVFILPRGANLGTVPERKQALDKKNNICKLLFVGTDWKRKGGEIAYEAFLVLKKMKIKVHFTIIGCSPPINNPDVTIIPNINKNFEQERQIYDKILRETSFLLLPTREECFGIIFAESSAYGIPSIATNTGGVSSAVVNEKTGLLLPISSRGKEYAMLIKDLFVDKEKYNKFRQSSRDYYEKYLNWDSWSRKLKIIIDEKILYH